MSYYLQALIGSKEVLDALASEFQHASVIPLAQGMALIPLTDQLHCEIGKGDTAEGFEKLSPAVSKWAQRISSAAPVTYVEAEFFGGVGGQTAVVWSQGAKVTGPIHSENAINQALRMLGVQMGNAHGEFDAMGLGRHRHTDDWIQMKPGA
jgi:hypothetical protein